MNPWRVRYVAADRWELWFAGRRVGDFPAERIALITREMWSARMAQGLPGPCFAAEVGDFVVLKQWFVTGGTTTPHVGQVVSVTADGQADVLWDDGVLAGSIDVTTAAASVLLRVVRGAPQNSIGGVVLALGIEADPIAAPGEFADYVVGRTLDGRFKIERVTEPPSEHPLYVGKPTTQARAIADEIEAEIAVEKDWQ